MLIKKIKKSNNIVVRSLVHLLKITVSRKYRSNNSILQVNVEFYYRYGKVISKILRPFLSPFAKKLKKDKALISVENIYNSIGHLTVELEELMKYIENSPKESVGEIFFIYPKNKILMEIEPIFSSTKIRIKCSGALHFWYQIIAIAFPGLSISVALSSLNYTKGASRLDLRQVFMGRVSSRIRRYSAEPNCLPFKACLEKFNWPRNIVADLVADRKYIVIQIKDTLGNATIARLEPSLMMSSILYLKELGYEIIMAGREKMPEIFEKIGVLDYANSRFATAMNDFLLISKSSFVISSGSGFCNIAEVLDKPLLVLNTWHHVFQGARKTIVLPRLLIVNNEILSCRLQLDFMLNTQEYKENVFNKNVSLDCVDITSKDILCSVMELIESFSQPFPKKYSEMQSRVKKVYDDTPLGFGLSRIPDFYLKKFPQVFLSG